MVVDGGRKMQTRNCPRRETLRSGRGGGESGRRALNHSGKSLATNSGPDIPIVLLHFRRTLSNSVSRCSLGPCPAFVAVGHYGGVGCPLSLGPLVARGTPPMCCPTRGQHDNAHKGLSYMRSGARHIPVWPQKRQAPMDRGLTIQWGSGGVKSANRVAGKGPSRTG